MCKGQLSYTTQTGGPAGHGRIDEAGPTAGRPCVQAQQDIGSGHGHTATSSFPNIQNHRISELEGSLETIQLSVLCTQRGNEVPPGTLNLSGASSQVGTEQI
jgi:hypothetical protein